MLKDVIDFGYACTIRLLGEAMQDKKRMGTKRMINIGSRTGLYMYRNVRDKRTDQGSTRIVTWLAGGGGCLSGQQVLGGERDHRDTKDLSTTRRRRIPRI